MEFLYGHWAVLECLRARRRKPDQLLLGDKIEEKGKVAEIIHTAQARGIPVKRVNRRILDDLSEGSNNKSTMLRFTPCPHVELDEVFVLLDGQVKC